MIITLGRKREKYSYRKNDNTINLTDYILNIDSKISDEYIEIINEKVQKMLKHKTNDNEFDFESNE